jgi:acid ceramidase
MRFTRNNTTLYNSAGFIGYIGVFTGVKAGKFSFSANERFSLDGGYVGIIEWLLGTN